MAVGAINSIPVRRAFLRESYVFDIVSRANKSYDVRTVLLSRLKTCQSGKGCDMPVFARDAYRQSALKLLFLEVFWFLATVLC